MARAFTADVIRRNPLDEYEIVSQIGSGTYGDVFKANRISTAGTAAIKVIKLQSGDDISVIQQEIVMLKDCRNDNIVAYFGSYLRSDKLWICMEFCGGGSLQDLYNVTGPLSERQIAFVCRETLSGLSYLHRMGKMHRDIKGANILLTESGDVKLADFGVSAQITATINKRRSFIGTPYWMAPEVAAVERKGGYSLVCDVWAVGITVIELAELQPPMFDLHPMRALFLMSKSSYRPPQLANRDKWSPLCHMFVKAALTKNAKKRPTADKLLTHPFVAASGLTKSLTRELIERARSSSRTFQEPDTDEEGAVANVPQRLVSRQVDSLLQPDQSLVCASSVTIQPPVQVRLLTSEPSVRRQAQLTNVNDIRSDNITQELTSPSSDRGVNLRSSRETECSVAESVSTLTAEESMMISCRISSESHASPASSESTRRRHSVWTPDTRAESSSDSATLTRRRLSRTRSLSNERSLGSRRDGSSGASGGGAGGGGGSSPGSPGPVAPPRRRERFRQNLPPPLQCHGLPPTPEVLMGACFSKVFNGCPLSLLCSAVWVHPITRDQHLLLAGREGVYTLNLNQLHEAAMEQLFNRYTTWIAVVKNVLISLSGLRNRCLYSHDLLGLHSRHLNRFSLNMAKLPELLVPRKLAVTTKMPNTKGCERCCVARNPYNGIRYLCGAVASGVFLMQWYDPFNKFLLLKHHECVLPVNLRVFEMVVKPNAEYPLVCVNVLAGATDDSFRLLFVDLNSSNSCFATELSEHMEAGADATLVFRPDQLQLHALVQLDANTMLLAYDNCIRFVDLDGQKKILRRGVSELIFDFVVTNVVCLRNSVLAFHRHGVQGRNFETGEVTQQITDTTKHFTVLGSDRAIALQSVGANSCHQQHQAAGTLASCNLYVLTGHEASH